MQHFSHCSSLNTSWFALVIWPNSRVPGQVNKRALGAVSWIRVLRVVGSVTVWVRVQVRALIAAGTLTNGAMILGSDTAKSRVPGQVNKRALGAVSRIRVLQVAGSVTVCVAVQVRALIWPWTLTNGARILGPDTAKSRVPGQVNKCALGCAEQDTGPSGSWECECMPGGPGARTNRSLNTDKRCDGGGVRVFSSWTGNDARAGACIQVGNPHRCWERDCAWMFRCARPVRRPAAWIGVRAESSSERRCEAVRARRGKLGALSQCSSFLEIIKNIKNYWFITVIMQNIDLIHKLMKKIQKNYI